MHLHVGHHVHALRPSSCTPPSLHPPSAHVVCLRTLPHRLQPTCSPQIHTPAQHGSAVERWRNLSCASASSSDALPSSPSSSSSSGSSPLLQVMSNTRPVDRLRYQARFVFRALDKERKGRLEGPQVQEYLAYSDARLGPRTPALENYYKQAGLLEGGKVLGFEQFVDVIRNQVRILSENSNLLNASVQGPELGQLLYNCCITTREMTQALVAFKLMDLDNDGYIPLQDLASTEGIERKLVDDVVDDVEEQEDKRADFKAYVQSYKRERPVGLTMAIMATHTLAFWLILNAPIDVLLKVLLSAFLVLKPQVINNPLIRLYQIARTLFGRSQAELEMRMQS